MNSFKEVMAIVEGLTEQNFIEQILGPYLAEKSVYIHATQVTKKGSKGGDVKYVRVIKDIKSHLKQRNDIVVTTFLDLYGLKEWPEKKEILNQNNYEKKIEKLYEVTEKKFQEDIDGEQQPAERVIPFFAVHEFEALLFSDARILARKLGCPQGSVDDVLAQFDQKPEMINDRPGGNPYKRIANLSNSVTFKKTTTGIEIAKEIGVGKMREKCPNFNQWLVKLENLNQRK